MQSGQLSGMYLSIGPTEGLSSWWPSDRSSPDNNNSNRGCAQDLMKKLDYHAPNVILKLFFTIPELISS